MPIKNIRNKMHNNPKWFNLSWCDLEKMNQSLSILSWYHKDMLFSKIWLYRVIWLWIRLDYQPNVEYWSSTKNQRSRRTCKKNCAKKTDQASNIILLWWDLGALPEMQRIELFRVMWKGNMFRKHNANRSPGGVKSVEHLGSLRARW